MVSVEDEGGILGGICCFFFQAEDGIRDAQESRGLGDVYKRQPRRRPRDGRHVSRTWSSPDGRRPPTGPGASAEATVSYTHLTLPTIYSV